jgi:hypothetical protein
MINKRLIDVLGTDLCERLIKYCKEKDIDEYVFVRGALANAMGLEHVPEHYRPVEPTPIIEDEEIALPIVEDEDIAEPDIAPDELSGDDENV